MDGKESQNVNQSKHPTSETKPPKHEPGAGLRGLRSTSMFRAVNPELYIRNNKPIMVFGVTALSACVAYIVYMNMKDEKENRYPALHEEGSEQIITPRAKQSRWD